MAAAAILDLFESKIAPLDPLSPKTPPDNQTWSGSDDRFRKYGHLKFYQDGGGRHLGFVRTVNSAIRSAVPENPTLEPNMKWIGSPVVEIWLFAYIGDIWNPHFRGKGRSYGVSDDSIRKSDGSFLWALHCDRCTRPICNHSAAICDRMSPTLKSIGGGHFWPKFRGIPLGADPSCWGCKERTSQAN